MLFNALKRRGFEVFFTSHAEAIFSTDFSIAAGEIEGCLSKLVLPITEIIGSGGGEAKSTQRLRRAFSEKQWLKTTFEIKKTINGREQESISHEVDHVRTLEEGVLALEIEWNNKDPFFDRDLENFKRLHADGAISLGIIVTRGTTLQDKLYEFVLRYARAHAVDSFDVLRGLGLEPTRRQVDSVMRRVNRPKDPLPFDEAWAHHFVSDKFGAATTHWRKLMDRVSRGVGNPCPLVLLGLPDTLVTFPASGKIEQVDEDTTDNDRQSA